MLSVQPIKVEDTYAIRHKVLRPNQTIVDCQYDGDEAENTFHLGVFHKKQKLICIGSFFQESHLELQHPVQYRLRGMATLGEFRNQQAGSLLISEAENILRYRGVNIWWCNARITASDYYIKQGLSQLGDVFEIHPIGLHKVMYKIICK
ncbi:GNAT family N-acetyltransferase [Bacillus sp. FSL K6-3431]|uniref:GNAT family N-acetyltransferase n=1 Tax=Bacillus sp. FSL K6-3431 TaxID=2921500 RepID=UPI0030F74B75